MTKTDGIDGRSVSSSARQQTLNELVKRHKPEFDVIFEEKLTLVKAEAEKKLAEKAVSVETNAPVATTPAETTPKTPS